MELLRFFCVPILLLYYVHLHRTVDCVKLDPDGGYHIVVGISDSAVNAHGNATEYVESVKATFDKFGELLWEATNATFFIKSVQIVVPDAWGDELEANASREAVYANADIQFSGVTTAPHTENYYPCAKPGVRIQLPFSFSDEYVTNMKYGSQSKGLLNLWLRYRFGVWEEHGYPHHNITPYVYNVNDLQHSPWILTSCNNSKLNGEYEFVDGSLNPANATCSTNGSVPMRKPCRFDPDPYDNDAISSVMNFQWVESISGLCDNGTHDKHAPNRQNLYCNFRSVWEVIRSSDDFKLLNNTSSDNETMHIQSCTTMVENVLPTIEYNIAVRFVSAKPLLYILLDNSYDDFWFAENSTTVFNNWLHELKMFLEELPLDIMVSLGTYPNILDRSATDLVRKVNWAKLDSTVKSEIMEVFQLTRNVSGGLAYFDFRLPLSEVISELKIQNHTNGAILLILRIEMLPYPGGLGMHLPGPYEADFVLDLQRTGITLCAVEVNMLANGNPHNVTLEYLALKSNGLYGQVIDSLGNDVVEQMRPVLDFVTERLNEDSPGIEDEYEILYKEMWSASFDQKSFLIPKRTDFDFLHIDVTIAGTSLDYIRFQLPNLGPFTERLEWAPWVALPQYDYLYASSYTYSKTVSMADLMEEDYDVWAWELYMTMSGNFSYYNMYGIRGSVTVYGTRARSSAKGDQIGNAMKTEIFTSADDNKYFGCLTKEVNEEPLAIYVKLSSADGTPILIRNPYKMRSNDQTIQSTLSAHLVNLQTGVVSSAALDDDGMDADLLAGDGVYSGYIYPYSPGGYRLYVTFYDPESRRSVDVTNKVNPIGRIHSTQQNDLEVGINGITVNTPYSMVVESPVQLRAKDGCEMKRYISRATDVQVEVTEEAEVVRVSFTVPGMTETPKIGWYTEEEDEFSAYYMGMARFARDMDTLIGDVNQGSLQPFLINASPPGRTEVVFLKRESGALVFAMELLDFRQPPTKSNISNIVRMKGWRAPEEGPREDDASEDSGCQIGCMLAIALGLGSLIIVLLIISFILWRKNRHQKSQLQILTRDEIKEFLHGHQVKPEAATESNQTAAGNEYLDCSERIQSLPYDSKYEIPNNKLHIDKTELLGSGTFGNVYKGYVVNLGGASGKVLIVAVKTMKPEMDKSYFKALLAEVKLMTHIGGSHPNIVKLIGACTKNIRKCEVFLATEFCTNGNLSSYLLKLNNSNFKNMIDENVQLVMQDEVNNNSKAADPEVLTTWSLIKWSREIANGMAYLGQKKIIHGDLAARNILLDSHLVAKIADFGLSKQLLQYAKYIEHTEVEVESGGGLLPWKWLSPEALTFSKFSVASDIWAYGITVWEIFSLGQVPYPGIKWSPDFVNQLEKSGLRLLKPDFATDTIYDIMCSCWNLEPKDRPGFNKLKTYFDQMMTVIASGEYMELQMSSDVATQRISELTDTYTTV